MTNPNTSTAPNAAPNVPEADLEAAFLRTAILRQATPFNPRKRSTYPMPSTFSVGLQMSDTIQQSPAILEAFGALPTRFFNPVQLVSLRDLSLAGHYAYKMQQKARAQGLSEVKLPPEVSASAKTLRTRLVRLVSYHLDDHPTAGPEIASILEGAGYEDTALDLERLADLVEAHRDRLESDQRFYRAADADTAHDLSLQILRLLGAERETAIRTWTNHQQHILSLLIDVYDDVRDTALWIFRDDLDTQDLFPPLYKK